MANRRMFSKEVTNSDEFLDMPLGSQALYFHLGMNADDDGFVQPKSIMRLCQSKDDELKILIVKGFLIPFHDSVIVITHWKINNELKNDRIKPTIYQEHLTNLGLTSSKMYIQNNNLVEVYPECIQNVSNVVPQYSIDKDRLVEISIVKNKKSNDNFHDEVIDYFNFKTGKEKYKKGTDRNLVIKYVKEILKSGDNLDDIKNLIDYKLSSPHTQNIDLTSWLNSSYVGMNMSKSKTWIDEGRKLITQSSFNDNNFTLSTKERFKYLDELYINVGDHMDGCLCGYDDSYQYEELQKHKLFCLTTKQESIDVCKELGIDYNALQRIDYGLWHDMYDSMPEMLQRCFK